MPSETQPHVESQLWLEYLDTRRAPLTSEGMLLHRSLCASAPEHYAALLRDPASTLSHKREVLANLLRVPAARGVSAGRMRELLGTLSVEQQLGVLDVLMTRRINSRRARTLLRDLILGSEQLPLLAATHRQRVVRLLKHAHGARTWSAVAGHLASSTPEGDALLQRKLLRHARDGATAREALAFLAGVASTPSEPLLAKRVAARKDIEAGAGLPRETLFGLRGIYHPDVPANRVRVLSAVSQVAERRDGPLTALYKDALLDPATRGRLDALPAHVQAAAGTLPIIDAHVAIVLDLSASAASSGERAYHPAALGLALARILESCVRRVSLHQVGGSTGGDGLPQPQGATDLATAMLASAREDPRVLLVISDGYENVRPGDAARVAEGLRRLGRQMTIYHVVPLFAAGEDLAQRRLGAPILTIPVLHENDVRELLARILLSAGSPEQSQEQSSEEATLVQDLVVAR